MYKITIAISTYNRERFLPGLFDSIVAQTIDKSMFETIVVDNNSTDNTAKITKDFIKDHPELSIRYVMETNQGLSFGRNRGITEAKGEYITFADDDALLAPDFLEKVCQYLDNHKDVSEVGGKVLLEYLCPIPNWENKYMNSLFAYFVPSDKEYVMKVKNNKYPRGCNMTFRMDAFEKAGTFNTELGRLGKGLGGGEEKDIAFRLIDCNLKVAFDPKVVVYHRVPKERTTIDFIKRQAIGIGESERIRSKATKEYGKRILIELFKWGATILLWFKYIICLKPVKANILVKFRWWISKGLLKKSK